MCTNVYAYFKCRDEHEQRQEDGRRFKYLAMCDIARNDNPRIMCLQRVDEHVLNEDDTEEDCPECKGETPPQSPS